jgi:hypothetical protein
MMSDECREFATRNSPCHLRSGGAQTNATGFNDGQSAGQTGKDGRLLNEILDQAKDELGVGVAR